MRRALRQGAHSNGWHSWVSTGNLLIGSVVALVAAVFSLGMTCAHGADRLESLEIRTSAEDRRISLGDLNSGQKFSELERQVESLRQQLTITQTDVQWIRRELERRR